MAGLTADFQPPPLQDIILGAAPSASGRSPTATELAAARVGRVWAGWFFQLYRRFSLARFSYREVTASFAVVPDDCTIVAKLMGNVTGTLLDASLVRGQIFYFKNDFASSGAIGFAGYQAQMIDGIQPASFIVAAGESMTLVSSGMGWIAIARYYPPPTQVAT
jgi:hypothetical protein